MLRKTVAAIVCIGIALLLVCVCVVPQVASASTDLYGFDLSTPSEFDPNDGANPYGKGNFALSTKSEMLVWHQGDGSMDASVYNYDEQPGVDGMVNGIHKIHTVASGGSSYKFVSTVGYDPDGTGKNNSVAAVGLDDSDDDEQKLVVMRYNGTGGLTKSRKLNFMRDDDDDDSDFQDGIAQWAYNAYFVVTSGDYDGNGTDELAVYFMQRGNPRVLILNGQTLETIRELPLVNLVGSTGAYLSSKFTKDAWTARATLQISMDSADIDRDGCDDLLVVASYADIYDDSDGEELKNRSSVLGYYKSGSVLKQSWTLDSSLTGHYMRTASVAAGDIDNDGFDDVVVAGYFMDSDGPDADDELNDEKFLITTFSHNASTGVEGLHPGVSKTVSMNEFTRTGYYDADTMVGTPALTCFRARGRNEAEEVFLAGTIYRWGDNDWDAVNTASHCKESDRGIGSWLITNTWVNACVAANFDSNELGAEQVAFSSGYKQDSVSRFFYRVSLVGYGTKKDGDYLVSGDFYECDNKQVVDRSTKGNRPSCSFAALDVDDDTDIFRYKKKSFTYGNVNVMAVLQAPPYFDDLKNEYFAAVGTTCYGEVKGGQHSTKVTQDAKVGCFGVFDAEGVTFEFTAEATYEHDWIWEYENSLSQEFSWTLENHSFDNAVALYRTPITLYDYEVTPANGGKKGTMTVGIPEEPVYVIIDAQKYNELVAKDPTMSGMEVTPAVAGCTAGMPDSYPVSPFGLANFTGAPNKIGVSNKNSTQDFATQVITTGESSSSSQSYTHSVSLRVGLTVGFGAFGASCKAGGGVQGGYTWGEGETTVDYSSVVKTGQVAFPPGTEDEYAFNFRFGTWSIDLGQKKVPVLGYIVDGVTSPPSRPKDIAVETVTTDSITIGWKQGAKSPQLYEVYQYFDDDISGEPYSLLAVVDGRDSTFTYEGLSPSTTYHLAMRAVNYEDGKRIASPYTATVSGTTLSDAEAPIITSITKEQNVRVNDTATFAVTARPSANATSGLTYAWQLKEAGSTNWHHCGATSEPTLTLANVSENMNGNHYRCVVSETIGGTRRYAYSGVGVLNVGMADSSIALTATNVDERANNEYKGTNRGRAGVVKVEDDPDNAITVPTNKTVTATIAGEDEPRAFVQYRNKYEGKNPEFVYLHSGTYYVLEGFDESAGTAEAMVPLALSRSHFSVEGDANSPWNGIAPSDLVRTGSQATYTVGGVSYLMYELDDQILYALADGETTKWYEFDQTTSLVEYAKDTTGAVPIYLEGEEAVFVRNGRIVESSNFGAISYDKYWPSERKTADFMVYRASDGTGPWFVANDKGELEELSVTHSDGLYYGDGEKGAYVVQIGDAIQVDSVITPQKIMSYEGDTVRLAAKVSTTSGSASLDGTVVFVVNNKTTGTASTFTTTSDASGIAILEWCPEEAGVYDVTAAFGGNSTLNISTASVAYYALEYDEPEESVYSLDAPDAMYGDTIELSLARMAVNDGGNLIKEELPAGITVRYHVLHTSEEGEEVTEDLGANHSYTPTLAGDYTFVAQVVGDKSGSARHVVHVRKRPIVIAAPSKAGLSSAYDEAKVPSIEDVRITYKGDDSKEAIVSADKQRYAPEVLLNISTTPVIDAASSEGVYETNVSFLSEDDQAEGSRPNALVQEFLKRYEVEFQSGKYVVEPDIFTVGFSAGSNGSVDAYKGSSMRSITTGDSVEPGTKMTFVARPDNRFVVETWNVIDGEGHEIDYETNDDGDQITIPSMHCSVNVHVTFKPASFQLSFAAGAHGSVSCAYLVDGADGTSVESPEDVANGKGVVLTATPDEGYVVERWTIARGSNPAQDFEDEYGLYSGETLRIEHVDANMSVRVYFVEEEYHLVSTLVVDQNNELVPGCSVKVSGVDADGMARHGSRITLAAEVPDQVVVKEWRLYLTDTTYTVLQGSSPSYVVGSLQYSMRIGIEVAPFKQFKVHYNAEADDGTQMDNVVAARSSGVPIAEGGLCTAYVPIDFMATVPDEYQVSSWSLRSGTEEDEVVASGSDALAYTLGSLQDETWLTLHLERKPTLAFEVEGQGGTIACMEQGRVSGNTFTKYRAEDFAFVLTPDEGYEVDSVVVEPEDAFKAIIESAEDGSDIRSYALKAPQNGFDKSLRVKASFKELPHIDVSFGLYDDGSGTHGTITANAIRKADDRYTREAQQTTTSAALLNAYRDSTVTISAEADEGYGIVSWLVNGEEVLGTQQLPYAHVGPADNVLELTLNEELLAALGDESVLQVVAQHGLRGGAVTFGTKGNVGGNVTASTASGAPVEYGTIFAAPETLTFEAWPNPKCAFAGWEVNGLPMDQTNTTLSLEVDGLSTYDVRAIINQPLPVDTHTLTYTPVGDEGGLHGSVFASVSKLPVAPPQGFYSSTNHSLDDALPSGCAVDTTTGVTLAARPDPGYAVKGWYADKECTIELAGSEEEARGYEIASLEADTSIYVKFEPIPSFSVEVIQDGAGKGSFAILVDGREIGQDKLTGTENGVACLVTRHSSVEIVARPASSLHKVAAWNGVASSETSYHIEDVTANDVVTLTFSPTQVVEVLMKTNDDCANARVTLLSGEGEEERQVEAVNKSVRVTAGETLRFDVAPVEGKMVDWWKVTYANGTVVEGNVWGIDEHIVLEDLMLGATVEVAMRSITAHMVPTPGMGAGSGFTVSEAAVVPDVLGDSYIHKVRDGGTVSLVVSPEEDYVIDGVADSSTNVDESSNILTAKRKEDGSYLVTITNIRSDVNLQVDAKRLHTVRIAECENGRIEVRDADGNIVEPGAKVRVGTQLTVCAVPNQNCVFDAWEVPLQNSIAPLATHVLESDITFGARFSRTCLVTLSANDLGTVSATTADGVPVVSGQRLREGTVLKLTAKAKKDCVFEGWNKPTTATDQRVDWTLTKDTVVEARFYRTYKVTIVSSDYGTVKVTDPTGRKVTSGERIREGTKLKIKATPKSKRAFVKWSKTLAGKAANTTWKIASDAQFVAHFCRTWLVTVSPSALGTVVVTKKDGTAITSGQRVPEGTVLKIKAVPAPGSEFSWWTSTLKGKADSVSWKVTSNVKLAPTFTKLPLKTSVVSVSESAARIEWSQVPDASRYVVYRQPCDGAELLTKYKTYKAKVNAASLGGLKRGGTYKFKVVAQKKVGKTYQDLLSSEECHFVTVGHNGYTNPFEVAVTNKRITLSIGKKASVQAQVVKQDTRRSLLGHVSTLRYKSSNPKVATVSAKGNVKAKRVGMCTIYAIAENGLSAEIRVTVNI